MSSRGTGLLLAIAILLGAFIYLYEIRGGEERAAAASDEKRVFPGIEARQIEWIELRTRDGVRARVARGDRGRGLGSAETWQLEAPVGAPGDQVALDAMASALVQLEVEGRVETEGSREADLAPFGLADESGELRFRADGEEFRLRTGRTTPVGGHTYVWRERARGDWRDVSYVQTWRLNALNKELKDLRERRILHFDRTSVRRMTVRWPGAEVVLALREAGWQLISPVEERADADTVETLLSDLAFLQADGFIDERPPDEELGLDEPEFQVLLSKSEVEAAPFEMGFAIGAARGDERVARGSDGVLYLVDAERLDELPRQLVEFRFKELSRFEVADARRLVLDYADQAKDSTQVRSLEARFEGSAWRTTPIPVPSEAVSDIVAELARMEASRIVADSLGPAELASLGLSPPVARMRVEGEEGAGLADVRLGIQRGGSGIFAMREGSPVVYRLDADLARLIPTSWQALEEEFAAAPAEDADDEAIGDDAIDPAPEPASEDDALPPLEP